MTPFLPQSNPDGSPNADALFLNAVLVSALYHNDRRPFDLYAAQTGCTVARFMSDKLTFQPDLGLIVGPGQALVVLDGTTNSPQWVSHCASAFLVDTDGPTRNTAVGSFRKGLDDIYTDLLAAIAPAMGGDIIVTGHSYGAGCAKILCDRLQVMVNRPRSLSLMTFGEPKSTGSFGLPIPPYSHMRIVGQVDNPSFFGEAIGLDPVTFTPPGVLQMIKWNPLVTLTLSQLGIKWKYFGVAWGLNSTGISRLTAYDDWRVQFDPIAWLYIVENSPYAALHFMDASYLTQALKLWQTHNQM